jgi:hypothetical protein
MHLNFFSALPLTVFASSAFYIKTKSAGGVSSDSGFTSFGKQLPYQVKNAGISNRIAARSFANRRLVDFDYFVYLACAENIFVFAGLCSSVI